MYVVNDIGYILFGIQTEFLLDMNGKRSAWEGIALIPFIDEQRLLKTVQGVAPERLTRAEREVMSGCAFSSQILFIVLTFIVSMLFLRTTITTAQFHGS